MLSRVIQSAKARPMAVRIDFSACAEDGSGGLGSAGAEERRMLSRGVGVWSPVNGYVPKFANVETATAIDECLFVSGKGPKCRSTALSRHRQLTYHFHV